MISNTRGVMWSSDGDLSECKPDPGWNQCRALVSPTIEFHATGKVTPSALWVIEQIYTDITKRLRPAYPSSRFDGFKVYVTNGETQQQLDALSQIAEFAPDPSGKNSKGWARGGAPSGKAVAQRSSACPGRGGGRLAEVQTWARPSE